MTRTHTHTEREFGRFPFLSLSLSFWVCVCGHGQVSIGSITHDPSRRPNARARARTHPGNKDRPFFLSCSSWAIARPARSVDSTSRLPFDLILVSVYVCRTFDCLLAAGRGKEIADPDGLYCVSVCVILSTILRSKFLPHRSVGWFWKISNCPGNSSWARIEITDILRL